jgi:hypothetical protein
MAISYDPATNIITVTGGTESAPHNFEDIYNADKAGTFDLYDSDRTVTGTDPSAIAVDNALRPADEVILGGPAGDLYIEVLNWNATTSEIEIVGTDKEGNAQSETITVTGNGTYNTVNRYKTITSTQVKTLSGTSYDYNIIQGQWGVVARNVGAAKKQYELIGVFLHVGDDTTETWFIDVDKNFLCITPSGGIPIFVHNNAHLRFGELINAADKRTRSGCSMKVSGTYPRGVGSDAGAYVELYGSLFVIGSQWFSRFYFSHGGNQKKIYECIVQAMIYTGSLDMYRTTITQGESAIRECTGTFEDLLLHSQASYVIRWAFQYGGDLKNVVIKDPPASVINIQTLTADRHAINVESPSWAFTWSGTSTKSVYRQYEFDVTCVDKTGSPLNEVSAVGEYINPYGQAFSVSTGPDGKIATQTIDHGFFDQAHGSEEQLKTPLKVTYSKPGYQTVVKYYPMDEKTVDTVVMHKAVKVFADFGRPVINLKKSDPENKNVLVL